MLKQIGNRLMTAVIPRPTLSYDEEKLKAYVDYVVRRVQETPVQTSPYHHMHIESVLPDELYSASLTRLKQYRSSKGLKERLQDSPDYINRRYSLTESDHAEAKYIRNIFEAQPVKQALVDKFYVAPTAELVSELRIHHEEFEFVFIPAGRFQNIHVDIPAKFLSFVFYFPDRNCSEEEQQKNGTVLYDKSLEPYYSAKYSANSVGIFAPHFYSYHGFSTTIDRQVMVMFYVSDNGFEDWVVARRKDAPPFSDMKNCIAEKLRKYSLIEYASIDDRVDQEKRQCLINAPRGRVMLDRQAK